MAIKDTLKKLVAFGSKPNQKTFPELVDVIIWTRCAIAIFYAIHFRERMGGIGVLFALNSITFIPFLYCSVVLGVDSDSYDNLLFAGITNCLALFLLVWICLCTPDTAEDEA